MSLSTFHKLLVTNTLNMLLLSALLGILALTCKRRIKMRGEEGGEREKGRGGREEGRRAEEDDT